MNTTSSTTTITAFIINITTTTISEKERSEYLDQLQAETILTMIPAIIFLTLLSVTGLVGNSLVLYIYSMKFTQKPGIILILFMASFDLMASVMSIPFEIYDMFHIWEFKNAAFCKFIILVKTFTTLTSAMILLAIAVVRYRKICSSHGWQINRKHAKIISVSIIFLAILFAIPNTIVLGRQTKQTPRPDIQGTFCSTDDKYVETLWPVINDVFYVLLFFATCVPLVVLYTRIGTTAWKHRKLHGVPHASETGTKTFPSSTETEERRVHEVVVPEPTPKMDTPPPSFFDKLRNLMSTSPVDWESNVDDVKKYERQRKVWQTPWRFSVWSINNGEEIRSPTTGHVSFRLNRAEQAQSGSPHSLPETISSADESSTQIPTYLTDKSTNSSKAVETTNQAERFKDEGCDFFTKILEPRLCNANNNAIGALEVQQQPRLSECNTKTEMDRTRFLNASKVDRVIRRKPIGRTTFMLIGISAIYVISFLPYLGLSFFKALDPKRFNEMTFAESVLYNFFVRTFFLHGAVNPVIYSLCVKDFRRECAIVIKCRST